MIELQFEIWMSLILIGIVVCGIFYVIALLINKISEKNFLEKSVVVYPETLFDDIKTMRNDLTLRLYSKVIDKHLIVITTNQISDVYKDGTFITYSGKSTTKLKAKKESLKEFLKKVPEINYKSMIKRKNYQVRVECKPLEEDKYWFVRMNMRYASVGFEIFDKYNEEVTLFNTFYSRKNYVENYTIYDLKYNEFQLKVCKLGDIRYCYYYDPEINKIGGKSIGYYNEKVSTFNKIVDNTAIALNQMPTIVVANNDQVQFSFVCLNLSAEKVTEGLVKLRVSAFASDAGITIKERTLKSEKDKIDKLTFADESYACLDGSGISFVSGIIKGFSLKLNELTGAKYWAIDIDCLGVQFKVLVDNRMFKAEDIEIGKVLCGEMYCTAFIED